MALFSYQAVQFGIPSHYPSDYTAAQRDAFRTRQLIQVGGGALFLVTYLWGVIDAFTNQQPAITTRRTERPLTPERTSPGASSSLLITPVVGPDSVGLGATWRF